MKPLVGAAAAAIIAGIAMLGIAHAQATDRPDCTTGHTTPWPLPDGWTVAYHCGPSPVDGAHALTAFQARRIDVWPESIATYDSLDRLLAHETGHAWDAATLDAEERQTWRQLRGLDDGPWHYDISAATELDMHVWTAAPGEDWADTWAACHGQPSGWFDPPTDQQCEVLRDMTGEVTR